MILLLINLRFPHSVVSIKISIYIRQVAPRDFPGVDKLFNFASWNSLGCDCGTVVMLALGGSCCAIPWPFPTVQRATAYFEFGPSGVEPSYRITNCENQGNTVVLHVLFLRFSERRALSKAPEHTLRCDDVLEKWVRPGMQSIITVGLYSLLITLWFCERLGKFQIKVCELISRIRLRPRIERCKVRS